MRRLLGQLSVLLMLVFGSQAYGETGSSHERSICPDPHFFGFDLPIQDYELMEDQILFDPIHYFSKLKFGYRLIISGATIIIDYDFEKNEINNVIIFGDIPIWVSNTARELNIEIFSRYLKHVMNSEVVKIIGIERKNEDLEKILISYGGGDKSLEKCIAPVCGCIGYGEITGLSGTGKPKYSIMWKR